MSGVRFTVAICTAVLLGACASAPRAERGRGQDRTALAVESLKPHGTRTLYEVIRLERPQWLSARGPTSLSVQPGDEVIVYLNGAKLGGVEHLRDITANLVASVRFLTGPEAQSRFGMDHQSGAILITTLKD